MKAAVAVTAALVKTDQQDPEGSEQDPEGSEQRCIDQYLDSHVTTIWSIY